MRDLFADPVEAKPLRPHQTLALDMLRQSFGPAGKRRPVLQLATGAGKTRIAAEIINGALSKGRRVAFIVPAISLIDQSVEAFEGEGISRINVIQGDHPRRDPMARVHVVSAQSLARRERPAVDLVVVDEAHLRHKAVLSWMRTDESLRFVGLSATPWARGMAEDWDDLLRPVSMQELIDAGYLAPFRVFAPSHPDLSKVRTKAGDFHEGDLSAVMSENRLVADVVTTWKRQARGLPTLVFAVDRAHAETLQRQFAAGGVEMGYCDAHVDRIARRTLFARMARGEISGICNVGTLTTGVDADVRCVVMARPTKSEMLFVQCIGRALRPAAGKSHAVVLDHADNHARHGFVTDIHHDALLSGKDRAPATRQEKGERLPKECPKCGVLRLGRECLACGFTAQRNSDLEYEAGELHEIKASKPKATMADKQRFWSMALQMDHERGKGGRMAKALYKAKWGVWPQGLKNDPLRPDAEFLSYEHSNRIRRAMQRRVAA